jgi:hypothetical protein
VCGCLPAYEFMRTLMKNYLHRHTRIGSEWKRARRVRRGHSQTHQLVISTHLARLARLVAACACLASADRAASNAACATSEVCTPHAGARQAQSTAGGRADDHGSHSTQHASQLSRTLPSSCRPLCKLSEYLYADEFAYLPVFVPTNSRSRVHPVLARWVTAEKGREGGRRVGEEGGSESMSA